MEYYRQHENHSYLFNIQFSVDLSKKNKKNHQENLGDCKANLILSVKDD